MRHRLRLLKPERREDGQGADLTEYVETAVARAELVQIRGSLKEEAGERFPDYTTEWRLRAGHEIGEHWRVEEPGGNLYTVVSVMPNKARGMLTLRCERVNE